MSRGSGGGTVTCSVVARVAVHTSEAVRARRLRVYCNGGDAARLARAAPRRLAGELALKRAAIQAFRRFAPGRTFRERDFHIGRFRNGAPVLRGFPAIRNPSRRRIREALRVSLSYTADHAYAMVVYPEELGG